MNPRKQYTVMNRLSRNLIICFLILIFGFNLFFYINIQPVKINKVFKNAIVVRNNNIEQKIEIRIDGILQKSDFLFKILSFREDIKGTIYINNEKYYLNASNFKKYTNNCMWGEVTKKPKGNEYKFIIFMFDNLNSIYLSEDDENYSIAAPAKTIKEYKNIKNKMTRK